MPDDDLLDLDEAGARRTVKQLLDQLKAAREAVEAAQRRAAGFRKMIDALVEMFPAIEDHLPEDLDEDEPAHPRGAGAVWEVLGERMNQWFTVPTIVGFLERKGWAPQSSNPANAVRSALERLVESDEIKKSRSTTGSVIYRVYDQSADGDLVEGEEPF